MSDSATPWTWNFPGQNTEVGSYSFLQGIFPTQVSHIAGGFFTSWATRPCFNSWVRKICWRRNRPPTPVFLGFPCGSAGKESACNVGDLGWGDSLEKGKATHSSILAWKIPSPWGGRVRHDWVIFTSLHLGFNPDSFSLSFFFSFSCREEKSTYHIL